MGHPCCRTRAAWTSGRAALATWLAASLLGACRPPTPEAPALAAGPAPGAAAVAAAAPPVAATATSAAAPVAATATVPMAVAASAEAAPPGASDDAPVAALPHTPTPAVGLEACLRAVGAGRTDPAALDQLRAFVGTQAASVQCWARQTAQGPVAVVQRHGDRPDALLLGATGKPIRVAASLTANWAVAWVCSTWTTGDACPKGQPCAPFRRRDVPEGRWWPDLPFVALAGEGLQVAVAVDTDVCKGFELYALDRGRWRPTRGGGRGCLVPDHTLKGVADLDGDGLPERLVERTLANFSGDGDMAHGLILQPTQEGQAIAWDATPVVALYRDLWGKPHTPEPDRDAERQTLTECQEDLLWAASKLHAGFLAQAAPADLKAFAQAHLGRYGRGACWTCKPAPDEDGDSTLLDSCKAGIRAVRCALDSGRTGREVLAGCWKPPS